MYGSKEPGGSFDDPDGAKFIADELRRCNFVGLYLHADAGAPVPGGCVVDQGRHVITAWGDERDEGEGEEVPANPDWVWVTDSDRSTQLEGEDQGPGKEVYGYYWDPADPPTQDYGRWYIDYFNNNPPIDPEDPYLWNIVTLSPPDTECDGTGLSVTGSYKITQDDARDATGLRYKAGAYDSPRICTYSTALDYEPNDIPRIVKYHIDEGCWGEIPECEYVEVEWELTGDDEVAQGTEVTITTEFLLPNENVISYKDVHFTYADPETPGASKPSFGWTIDTPPAGEPTGGGFVVGAFELYSDSFGTTKIGEYRFQHEYGDDDDPNIHYFELRSLEDAGDIYVGNLRFGHRCNPLTGEGLWTYGNYIDEVLTVVTVSPSVPYLSTIEWDEATCNVPAVSEWGLVALALLTLTAGTIVVARRRRVLRAEA